MRLLRIPEPFDHPDFIFEPKMGRFRGALAHVNGHRSASLDCGTARPLGSGSGLDEGVIETVKCLAPHLAERVLALVFLTKNRAV